MSRRRVITLAGAALVLSSLIAAAPALVSETRRAAALARMPYKERRHRVLGPLWDSIDAVKRIPGTGAIPIVMRRPEDIDPTLLVSSYLYPRATKHFWSLEFYRSEPISLTAPAVYIDTSRTNAARVMTYLDIRAEQIRDRPLPVHPLPSFTGTDFMVPFAAAVEGGPPDAYMTEVVFVPENAGSISMTFEPAGERIAFAARPGERIVYRDVVYEAYHHLGIGWLRVSATTPVHAAAWLVNRGREQRAEIALFAAAPPLPQRLGSGDRLWLLNSNGRATRVMVNGTEMRLPSHALTSVPSLASNNLDEGPGVLAFTSRKLPNGNTEFAWP